MKNFKMITIMAFAITMLASCDSAKQDLTNPECRNEIMTSIANDQTMSNEMMTAMMGGPNGRMIMQENQHMKMMMMDKNMMADMMKNNPEMMQRMMTNMMESAAGDTSMMSEIYETMMGNQQMMDMMQRKQMKRGQNMNMENMKGMK